MLAFKREAVALVVLAFYFLALWSANPGIEIAAALTFAAPKEVEAKAINSATNCPSQVGALDVRGRGRETNSGSKRY